MKTTKIPKHGGIYLNKYLSGLQTGNYNSAIK